MQITIRQKPFGYFKITPYLVFIDGELVGHVNRCKPLKIDVEKEEFELTIKDNFYKSTRRCQMKDSSTIVFDTIDNFPICLYLLYLIAIIVLTCLHVNLYLPTAAIIATMFVFPILILIYDMINRKNFFLIEY